MTKKGQFVSTLLASMAANLVWNLNPGVESTVRQLRPHPHPLHRPLTLRVSCWKKFNFISKHPLSYVVHAHRVSCFLLICFYPLKQRRLSYECKRVLKHFHIISNSAKLWDLAKTEYQLLPYFPSPKGSSHISLPVKCHMGFHRFFVFGFFV